MAFRVTVFPFMCMASILQIILLHIHVCNKYYDTHTDTCKSVCIILCAVEDCPHESGAIINFRAQFVGSKVTSNQLPQWKCLAMHIRSINNNIQPLVIGFTLYHGIRST